MLCHYDLPQKSNENNDTLSVQIAIVYAEFRRMSVDNGNDDNDDDAGDDVDVVVDNDRKPCERW